MYPLMFIWSNMGFVSLLILATVCHSSCFLKHTKVAYSSAYKGDVRRSIHQWEVIFHLKPAQCGSNLWWSYPSLNCVVLMWSTPLLAIPTSSSSFSAFSYQNMSEIMPLQSRYNDMAEDQTSNEAFAIIAAPSHSSIHHLILYLNSQANRHKGKLCSRPQLQSVYYWCRLWRVPRVEVGNRHYWLYL